MIIFTQGMIALYARNGIDIPSRMSQKDFKFFIKCHNKAFKSK